VGRDTVVVGTDGPPVGWLYAFDRDDGTLRWKRAFPRGVSTQVAGSGDHVFAVGGAGDVVALDVRTGAVVWHFVDAEPAKGAWARHDSALAGDLLLVPWPDGVLVAIDATRGVERWRRALGSKPNTSVVTTAGGAAWIGTEDGRLRQLDLLTGAPLATLDAGGLPYGDLQVADGCLLALTMGERHALSCHDSVNGELRWRRQVDAEISTFRPLVAGGVVIAGHEGRELIALALDSGEQRGQCVVAGTPRGLSSRGQQLFVGMLGGAVVALPLASCRGGS
jgi:outer membrane protein assembly factor BamB